MGTSGKGHVQQVVDLDTIDAGASKSKVPSIYDLEASRP